MTSSWRPSIVILLALVGIFCITGPLTAQVAVSHAARNVRDESCSAIPGVRLPRPNPARTSAAQSSSSAGRLG